MDHQARFLNWRTFFGNWLFDECRHFARFLADLLLGIMAVVVVALLAIISWLLPKSPPEPGL